MRGKGAGLRTHVLIGMGSALFMIVSKYGFADVLSLGHVGLSTHVFIFMSRRE